MRVGAVRDSVGSRYNLLGTTMAARSVAVREAINSKAAAIGVSVGERVGVVRGSVEASVQNAGKNFSARAQVLQSAMADLRLKYLPPVKQPSWARRLARRVNVFSTRGIQTRQNLTEYWQRTWQATRQLKFWKLNPFKLTLYLARDTKCTVAFFFSMMAEKH